MFTNEQCRCRSHVTVAAWPCTRDRVVRENPVTPRVLRGVAAVVAARELVVSQPTAGADLCDISVFPAVPPSFFPTAGSHESEEAPMSENEHSTEFTRVRAEKRREHAEDLRAAADHERGNAEDQRALAESARREAEQFRVLAEEARALREHYREQVESIRQEREALRQIAEEVRRTAEDARHATIAALAATADALSAHLAQMQFLEDARNTVRQLRVTKPDNTQ
jgi:hypothetical protein